MRRGLALALTLCLLCALGAARAESYSVTGFDTAGSGHDWSNNLFFSRMEEITGLTLNLKQYTDETQYAAFKESLLRGENLPDALLKASLSNTELMACHEQGVLIDLAPLIAEYMPSLSALLAEHPDWREAITLPDGAIVALPQFNMLQSNNIIWINAKWLRLLNLDMPTDAESLTAVLRAFRDSDPNRNGKADEIPLTFTGMWDLRFLSTAFGFVENDWGLWETADGLRQMWGALENREFLAWLHQLYEEKLIDHNGLTTSDSLRRVTDAKQPITYGVVFGPSAMNLLPAEAAQDYVPLMPLSDVGYRSLFGQVINGTFAITSACREPGPLLVWADTLYTDAGMYLAYVGAEGNEYTRTSDGHWFWNDDAETVSGTVLTDCTIGEGASLPGIVTREYQLAYDDEQTAKTVGQVAELAEVSVTPCGQIWLSQSKQARLMEIWLPLSDYAWTQMARFVAGDIPLNDETWTAYTAQLEQLGLPEALSLLKTGLKR